MSSGITSKQGLNPSSQRVTSRLLQDHPLCVYHRLPILSLPLLVLTHPFWILSPLPSSWVGIGEKNQGHPNPHQFRLKHPAIHNTSLPVRRIYF